eukprot:m.73960 g.73960  ORF g.73960 m.73960 type:complete len:359 (+) comp13919_c0_seq1:100-1176(+)
MDDKREKGEHAGRQLRLGSSLFAVRIALQKAIAPLCALTPEDAPREGNQGAVACRTQLTRLAWQVAQLQREMLDALVPMDKKQRKKSKSKHSKTNGDEDEDADDKSEADHSEDEEDGEDSDASDEGDADDDLNLLKLLATNITEGSQSQKRRHADSLFDEDDHHSNDSDEEDTHESEEPRLKKANIVDEQEATTEDDFLTALEAVCSSHHERLRPYYGKTADKWYTKTKLASGKDKGFKVLDQSLMVQITDVAADKMRSHATEKFDDTAFYVTMLKEHLEAKADFQSMDPIEMARHFLEMDALRSKIKKKVDTRASKGRKLRFHVHPKLVNFMAPDDTIYDTTSTAQKAIFASLFRNE